MRSTTSAAGALGKLVPALLILSFAALAQGPKKPATGGTAATPPPSNAGTHPPSQANVPHGPAGSAGMAGAGAGRGTASGNPYGSNARANTGTTAAAGKGTSHNPYGSYATANPSTSGKSAAGGGASSTSKNPYGSYATKNPSNSNTPVRGTTAAGSASGLNSGHGTANTGAVKGPGGVGGGASNSAAVKGSAAAVGARRGIAGGAGAGSSLRGANTNFAGTGKASARAGITSRQITTASGAKLTASYRGSNLRSIQTKNMKIEHGLAGQRRIVTERNGTRIVSTGKGQGYAERAYVNRGNRSYYQRTYYMGGSRYVYAYRGYYYGGVRYYGYAPVYYYQPVYYGWAYSPWAAPVYYRWGWIGNPWYGYYNYYYAPYPVYPAASFWLTDFLIAENLRLAYGLAVVGKNSEGPMHSSDSTLMAGLWSNDPLLWPGLHSSPAGGWYAGPEASQPQMGQDVKDALAAEVKQQLAADKAAADKSRGPSADDALPALDSNFRYFIVASNLDLDVEDGPECALTQGDVIQRTSDTPDEGNRVEVIVKSSKKGDCALGTNGLVDVNELQEMYNHFRESLEVGLKSLAENSGKDGLPKAPDTSTTEGEVPPPAADASVESDLQQQQREADQTEAQIKRGSKGQ